ncbi:MAG: hypothetical protein ACD_81C00138G0004 [uncultured bacterium]|uniref:Methyltransferase domain-containing protein n=1 Tax=Candidatus Wolfebacteria bacterium GW2011_GWE2_44_13 TaxID=1619017 RepID=A0A0G1HBD4_9BACT|nr:MAG: hypothetical protein ACD_81C00138G0004 [uncultured bacterium]KKT43843.1 MAG: hypothetical protein UW32_C0001G0435 [Candidatus Wolfebacteria bacterium GW2011_GWE2_44_13]
MSVYDNVNCEELNYFAEQAGLGGESPADFLQFEKYLKINNSILEVGCGTGRIGKHLISVYKYIGIEQHQPYLIFFKNYLANNGIKNVEDMVIYSAFENYQGNNFDVIIFPWTVIGEFSKEAQLTTIKRAKDMLKTNGLILIDNPAKGTVYNEEDDYEPCKFYYDDWKNRLSKIFSTTEQILYTTPVGRVRELVILNK